MIAVLVDKRVFIGLKAFRDLPHLLVKPLGVLDGTHVVGLKIGRILYREWCGLENA